jgi:hypothetical protein
MQPIKPIPAFRTAKGQSTGTPNDPNRFREISQIVTDKNNPNRFADMVSYLIRNKAEGKELLEISSDAVYQHVLGEMTKRVFSKIHA